MVHQKQTRQVEGEFDMVIVNLIVQQLHAGVISLLPFAPIWLILLNLVTYVVLMLCVTVLLEYLDLFHTKCAKLQFLGAHFPISTYCIFPARCSLLLPTHFFQKVCWQNRCIPKQ